MAWIVLQGVRNVVCDIAVQILSVTSCDPALLFELRNDIPRSLSDAEITNTKELTSPRCIIPSRVDGFGGVI